MAILKQREELKKKTADPPKPLFKAFRELVLRKCAPGKRKQIRAIFEKEPFGELERLITQKLIDVAKGLAKEELDSEKWLLLGSRLANPSYRQVALFSVELIETSIFPVSV